MDTNLLFPLSHNTCEVVFDYFLEEDFIEARGLEGGREEEGGREGGLEGGRVVEGGNGGEGGREGGLERFVRESLEASDEVQREDTYLCENVQIGLESAGGREGGREGGYDRGRYAPKVEFLDYAFHQWLARDLGEAVRKVEEGEGGREGGREGGTLQG
jgi:choline monooxygenase